MDKPPVADIFDCHFHIIDPRYPLLRNQGYLPDPFSCDDYLQGLGGLGDLPVSGGTVVSGSFQGFDQGYLLSALQQLGENFVGVTQLPAAVDDQTLLALDRAGVRGLRFNLKRGGSEKLDRLDYLAQRVHEVVGWHTELYVDSAALASLRQTLSQLPALSIDHLGLSRAGWPDLLRLVEDGVRIKATGFSRGDLDPGMAMRQICAINPDALMFGTDLPCTRAPSPFSNADVRCVLESLDSKLHAAVFAGNARNFYRLD